MAVRMGAAGWRRGRPTGAGAAVGAVVAAVGGANMLQPSEFRGELHGLVVQIAPQATALGTCSAGGDGRGPPPRDA